jgi:hypothetical protein
MEALPEAIAAIRTFLNVLPGRDLAEVSREGTNARKAQGD